MGERTKLFVQTVPRLHRGPRHRETTRRKTAPDQRQLETARTTRIGEAQRLTHILMTDLAIPHQRLCHLHHGRPTPLQQRRDGPAGHPATRSAQRLIVGRAGRQHATNVTGPRPTPRDPPRLTPRTRKGNLRLATFGHLIDRRQPLHTDHPATSHNRRTDHPATSHNRDSMPGLMETKLNPPKICRRHISPRQCHCRGDPFALNRATRAVHAGRCRSGATHSQTTAPTPTTSDGRVIP
jgi:hypothetical protein